MRNEMIGEDSETWGHPDRPENHPPDLIGIKPRGNQDTFSRLVAENAIHLFKVGSRCIAKKHRRGSREVYYDSQILKFTLVMTSILASLIPIASIWVLMSLKSKTHQMVSAAAFNVLISACLNLTDTRRTDVFAVIAA